MKKIEQKQLDGSLVREDKVTGEVRREREGERAICITNGVCLFPSFIES